MSTPPAPSPPSGAPFSVLRGAVVLPMSPPQPPNPPPRRPKTPIEPSASAIPAPPGLLAATPNRRRSIGTVSIQSPFQSPAPISAARPDSPATSPETASRRPFGVHRRRTASLPNAFPGQIASARRALQILDDLTSAAKVSPDQTVPVTLSTINTLSAIVETVLIASTGASLSEMVMRSKFLSMPGLFDPDLQRFLLKEYTPTKAEGDASFEKPDGAGPPPPSPIPPLRTDSLETTKRLVRLSLSSPSARRIVLGQESPGSSPRQPDGPGSPAASFVPPPPPSTIVSPTSVARTEEAIVSLLSTADEWSFDVFALAAAVPGRTLVTLALKLFQQHGLFDALSVEQDVCARYFHSVEEAYLDNRYHNALHGADVAVSLHYFITSGGMCEWMSRKQIFAAIVSAFVHDLAHPALSNSFLVTTGHPYALKYNDVSPLENMHAGLAFELATRPGHGLFDGLSVDDRKEVRKTIIQMVLATDNEMHFDLLGKVTAAQNAVDEGRGDGGAGASDTRIVSTAKGQIMILQTALHAADVSNPSKPWAYYLEWTQRLMFEFYAQGDRERELGIPVTPMLDRTKPIPLPKFQAGFINAIVLPLYKELNRVDGVSIPVPLAQLESNLAAWNQQMLADAAPPPPPA